MPVNTKTITFLTTGILTCLKEYYFNIMIIGFHLLCQRISRTKKKSNASLINTFNAAYNVKMLSQKDLKGELKVNTSVQICDNKKLKK